MLLVQVVLDLLRQLVQVMGFQHFQLEFQQKLQQLVFQLIQHLKLIELHPPITIQVINLSEFHLKQTFPLPFSMSLEFFSFSHQFLFRL